MNDYQKKQLEDLDDEAFKAAAEFEKLKSSGNTLANDPVKRKQQFAEVREARMAVKVTAMKIEGYMDHLASAEATKAVEELIKGDEEPVKE